MPGIFFAVLTLFLSLRAFAGGPFVLVLGVAQDGGYPHAGCKRQCCTAAWNDPALRRYVVSLALVDSAAKKWWLFEATPDIREQLQLFRQLTQERYNYLPDGIFITHAHIGHYAGLMQLGREVMNAKEVPVFAHPTMTQFLASNGPWSQLSSLKNILLRPLTQGQLMALPGSGCSVEGFEVPHREEYSKTSGYRIVAGNRSYLFIPDIDKWEKWDSSIVAEVKKVDVALLDATFYKADELPGRKMEEVPHPFAGETTELFRNEPAAVKAKIHFIHLNHTNPLLWDQQLQEEFGKTGFGLARQGQRL